jgi:hypothetical protein
MLNLQSSMINMNPIAESLLVVAAATLSGLAFCTLIAGAWLAIHRHHEADLPPIEQQQIDALFTRDREFHEPNRGSRGDEALTFPGPLQIVCGHCLKYSPHLRALPNGNTVCPACHEKLVLDAVFTPLE